MPKELGGWGQPALTNDNKADWASYAYWLNRSYDGNTCDTDPEFDANLNGARKWAVGSLDTQDWAAPGKQSDPPF